MPVRETKFRVQYNGAEPKVTDMNGAVTAYLSTGVPAKIISAIDAETGQERPIAVAEMDQIKRFAYGRTKMR